MGRKDPIMSNYHISAGTIARTAVPLMALTIRDSDA